MRKTVKLFLPLLLLCTLLITMTALPSFAANDTAAQRFESINGQTENGAYEGIIDHATGTAIRLDYSLYTYDLNRIISYNTDMIIALPFAAELTLAIVVGVIAAWTLVYILWAVKVFPNGTGFDRVMEPCGKYFYRPFVASIRATCDKLLKNKNKLEATFYWTVLGLGTVHILARIILNLLFGTFSFGAQILIPLFALLLVFLVMGNAGFLCFRYGNFLPVVCSAGILTYLGFEIYASFAVSYELTLMIWISRVAMMALALFFIGVAIRQWCPEIIGTTLMQSGGALFVIFAGTRFLVHMFTVPGTFFTDLFLIGLVPLFYFVYRNLRYVPVATAAEETAAEETAAEETAAEEAAVEATAAEETAVEETAVEETAVEETAVEETAVEEAAVEEAPVFEDGAPNPTTPTQTEA